MPTAAESESIPRAQDSMVAAAKRGDREAIRALWERNRRWVAAVLLAHKPAFEDLEDLLQEVAVTFVSRIDTLREDTSLRAWLRTVAVNTARAAGRSGKYRPRPEPAVDHLCERNGAADDGAERDEQARWMMRRVQRLPEAYREPLLLRAMKGMRSKQIADILGVPPATVDTRLARARRMLRESDDGDPAAPDLVTKVDEQDAEPTLIERE